MSGRLRLLDLVKPFLPILPEIEAPYQKVSNDEKIIWTVTAALAFFVMSEIPLYKAVSSEGSADSLFWLRPILASSKGTLMELGLSPAITAGFIFQILGGTQLIDVNFDYRSDRELYQSAQKLTAILLTIGQAFAILFSGAYGSPLELGIGGVLLILVQLIGAGLLVIYMNEILEKGYGFVSGLSFFTTLNICQQVFWRTLSFSSEDFGRGKEYTGSLVALVHLLFTRKSFKVALVEAFYRTHLPNMFQLYGTVLMFGLVLYLQSFRVDVPIKSTKVRTPASGYPIRLLYTGNMPLYLISAITSNVFLLSRALYYQFPENLLVRFFGTWGPRNTHQMTAISGLAYYLQPPFSTVESLWDPIKTIVYAAFVIMTCTFFAKSWTEISGSSPRDVAKVFKQQGIVIVGHRDVSAIKELKRIIPVAASVGGAVVGVLAVVSDLFGSLGNGTAVVVAVTALIAYFEILAQEGFVPGMAQ